MAIIGALSILIEDKMDKVSIQAMATLKTLLQRFPPPPVANNQNFKIYIEDLIVALIIRCGDNKQNIKEMGMSMLELLGEERNTKPNLISSLLYRQKGLPKVCEDVKHMVDFVKRRKDALRL